MRRARLWPFYLYSFLAYLLPLYAVYILTVSRVLGDPMKIASLVAVLSATMVLLEVPGGALADLWSRKAMVVVAQLACLGSSVIWFIARDYGLLLIAFVLWGMSESFLSGAFQALLFEELEHAGQEKLYERLSGRMMFLMTSGAAVAVFFGGLLNERYPDFVYPLSIATAFLALLIALFLPADQESCKPGLRYREVLLDALAEIRGKRLFLRLLLYAVLYFAVIGTVEEFLQLWLAEQNIKGFFYGGMLTLIIFLQAGGAAAGSLFILGRRKEAFLYGGMAISGLLLIAGGIFPVLSLPGVAVVFFITGMMETKLESVTQEAIDGQRATLLSFNSLSMNLAGIFFALGIGSTAGRTSFITAFALCGGIILVSSIALFLMHRSDR